MIKVVDGKSQIVLPVFEDAEAFLRAEMDNLLATLEMDHVGTIKPQNMAVNLDRFTTYEDREDGSTKDCNLQDHIEALDLLCEKIGNKKLFVGGIKSPLELTDTCNWDVEVVDAYFQLVFFKEIVYG